jgi:hypothetical protein
MQGKWYNEGVSVRIISEIDMRNFNYWPLDDEPEGEIYENLAWDLPGYRPNRERQAHPKRKLK